MELEPDDLTRLYRYRFEENARERRDAVWRVLVTDFFQRWVPRDATVLDLAAGECEFVNNISAGRRIAVDLNPAVLTRVGPGIEVHVVRSDELTPIADVSIDRVFVSNFFEHVSRDVILGTLREAHRVLRPTGQLLILQPNIRFAARDYWQFFDHITPIDDRALAEALHQSGFDVITSIPRFLPYSTKGRLPTAAWLVRLYLRVPLAWRILGAQSFMVAAPRKS